MVDERELDDLHFWRDGFKVDRFTSVCTCGALQDIRDTIDFEIYVAKSVVLRVRCEFIASQRFPMERPAKRKNGKRRTTRHHHHPTSVPRLARVKGRTAQNETNVGIQSPAGEFFVSFSFLIKQTTSSAQWQFSPSSAFNREEGGR